MHWLKDGDINTKFFHAMASQRKQRNAILSLTNEDGHIVKDQEGICGLAGSISPLCLQGVLLPMIRS